MKKMFLISFFIISLLFTTTTPANKTFNISEEKLQEIALQYGKKARKRFELWDKVMQSSKSKDILHKLKDVNDFWNKIKYKRDIVVWRKKDYWATPFEFLSVGAGDCEDYAIAKYFSLRELGVPDSKLRITYVKLLRAGRKYEEAHMVLTYYHKPGATPIVLDNVNKKLKLATTRKDLRPVYSFNAQGLWQAKNRGRTSIRVGSNNLRNWKSMMSRI
ncbi:transglutaminase-like cysteine peptidase [Halarcobacter anaerophilus]|jgi:predicted transglutaminase-like cysteine proteinase|uniref:Transglutaminase n=1 Tax=Halarcobacter anaerophilus TaxID=877500 RepID=A0A4Q0XWX9_9BACT|nr:transglutaminase-like cysteine peptidase [Halarcobacter anaerophilus]QDF28245.1 putative transglutaminase-like cysteine proteinase, C93 family [Halarcobacter anaerophilus]RXJ62086.1 transglutaminase [Halarcobacter anaerophilus]